MGGEREVQEGGDVVYPLLVHVDIWQKLTQYCKAIIPRLKINKLKKKFFKVKKTKGKGWSLHPLRALCPTKNLEGRVPEDQIQQDGRDHIKRSEVPHLLSTYGEVLLGFISRTKPVSYKSQQEPEETYSCESMEDFRHLFKRTGKWLLVAVVGWPSHPCVSWLSCSYSATFQEPLPK